MRNVLVTCCFRSAFQTVFDRRQCGDLAMSFDTANQLEMAKESVGRYLGVVADVVYRHFSWSRRLAESKRDGETLLIRALGTAASCC